MVKDSLRIIYLVVGSISVALGFIGIFLPILPTAPFILLAAFCFSRSSEKMHRWLLGIPYFGQMINEWEKHGVIRPAAKIWATVMILMLFSSTLIFVKVSHAIKIIVALIGICVLGFILSRPSRPRSST